MYEFLKIVNIVGMAIAALNIFLVVSGRNVRGQKMLLLSVLSLLVHTVGVYLEFISTTPEGALNGLRIQYLVAGNAALFLMMFLFEYCGSKCPQGIWIPMFSYNVLTFALVLTCDRHDLYYKNMTFVEDGLYPHFETEKGIFYYIFMAQLCIIMVISILVAVRHNRKKYMRKNKEIVCMVLAVSVPCAVKIMHGLGFLGVYDPSMIATLAASLLLILSVSRYNMIGIEQLGKEQFVDRMQEGFLMVDTDFGFVSANKKAKTLFPELNDVKFGDRITQLSDYSMLKIVTSVTAEKEINGHFYEFRVTPIENGGEKSGYIICVFDVTSAHRSYIKMTELKERAESASKAKEIFLANMSHEIRTPMNAIVGMSSLLLETENLPENAKEYAQTIQTSSDTLIGIINDVLDFSKIESGTIEIINENYKVQDIVHDIQSIMKGRAEQKGLYFRIEVMENVPERLVGDKMRIKQVMLNLLGNAVKFTEQGGVTMCVSWKAGDENDGILSVAVEDTGIGIKESDFDKLFVDFSRILGKKVNYIEGTGLGLSICKRMLDMMGGTISVQSVYGKGSCFSFELPQKLDAGEQDSKEKPEAPPKPDTALEGVYIMVVDDNEVNLKVTKGLLETIGAVPILHADGESAVQYIKAGQKLPKMILMDYMMPGMDGIEAANEIRKLGDYGRNVPIIAVTADAMKGEEEKFMSNGFNGYLSKPINLQKLKNYLIDFAPSRSGDARINVMRRKLLGLLDVDEGVARSGNVNRYCYDLEDFLEKSLVHLLAMERSKDMDNLNPYCQEAGAMKRLAEEISCKRLENMSSAMIKADRHFINNNHVVYTEFVHKLQKEITQILEQLKNDSENERKR